MVYNDNPQFLVALKENIRREISSIEPSLLQRVEQNTRLRFEQCVQLDERHLEDIFFKKIKSAFLLYRSMLLIKLCVNYYVFYLSLKI